MTRPRTRAPRRPRPMTQPRVGATYRHRLTTPPRARATRRPGSQHRYARGRRVAAGRPHLERAAGGPHPSRRGGERPSDAHTARQGKNPGEGAAGEAREVPAGVRTAWNAPVGEPPAVAKMKLGVITCRRPRPRQAPTGWVARVQAKTSGRTFPPRPALGLGVKAAGRTGGRAGRAAGRLWRRVWARGGGQAGMCRGLTSAVGLVRNQSGRTRRRGCRTCRGGRRSRGRSRCPRPRRAPCRPGPPPSGRSRPRPAPGR